jgi:hypothetical protein
MVDEAGAASYKVIYENGIPTDAPDSLFGVPVKNESVSTEPGIMG